MGFISKSITRSRDIGRAAGGNGNDAEVYIMNADGTGQESLTPASAKSSDPAFSPDGEKIAFATNRDGNYEIYSMNIDGSDQTRLTDTEAASERDPTFSPEGTKIAFAANREGNYGIYKMNLNGSEQVKLTSNPHNNPRGDRDPSWSPDGEKIAFSSQGEYYDSGSHNTGYYKAIYVMDADGSTKRKLSPDSGVHEY